MKTSSKINKQVQRKRNFNLVKTILIAKKNKAWKEIAAILSGPRKRQKNINISEINKESKEGDIIVVPGKVLSQGEIGKKVRVVALNFSKKAKEKLLKEKCEIFHIEEEIKQNPEAKGVTILK